MCTNDSGLMPFYRYILVLRADFKSIYLAKFKPHQTAKAIVIQLFKNTRVNNSNSMPCDTHALVLRAGFSKHTLQKCRKHDKDQWKVENVKVIVICKNLYENNNSLVSFDGQALVLRAGSQEYSRPEVSKNDTDQCKVKKHKIIRRQINI